MIEPPGAFLKCLGMNDLHCYADNPPKLGNNVFLNVNLLNLYVPYGSIKAYKAAATWGDFENIHYNDEVKLNGIWYRLDDYGEGATVINNPDESYSYVYEGDIVIPSQVTVDDTEYEVWDIGNHAFADSKITSITLPNTLIGIGDGAFKGSKITSIDIPNSVYSIGEEAFQYCDQLKSLTLPNSLKIIPRSNDDKRSNRASPLQPPLSLPRRQPILTFPKGGNKLLCKSASAPT